MNGVFAECALSGNADGPSALPGKSLSEIVGDERTGCPRSNQEALS
jgi:hypothetical protein